MEFEVPYNCQTRNLTIMRHFNYGLKNTSGYIFLNLHSYKSISSNNQLPVTQDGLNDGLKEACNKAGIERQENYILALYSLRVYLSSLLGNNNRISNMYACQRMGKNTIQVFLSTHVLAFSIFGICKVYQFLIYQLFTKMY